MHILLFVAESNKRLIREVRAARRAAIIFGMAGTPGPAVSFFS
jgi:hypothetical protein